MLIIPLSGKVSRHNSPVATIILIAVNCLVGCVHELGCGRRAYLGIYLVGASGAIAPHHLETLTRALRLVRHGRMVELKREP